MEQMTNSRRLRALNDEELAKFLCHLAQSGKLTMDDISDVLARYEVERPSDFECMLTWLRSPSE